MKKAEPPSSSCSFYWPLTIAELHKTAFSLILKSGAETLYFLKYMDTNLVLRMFKNLSKSLTVTGNILGCCEFRVGDYCGEAKAVTVSITTRGKRCFGCFVCGLAGGGYFLHQMERVDQQIAHPQTDGACVYVTPEYLS